jgi:hypothetical protein
MNATLETNVDGAIAAAKRRFDASVELLMSFDPTAEQLTEAARAMVKIAHRAINPRKSSADEDA